MPQKPKRKPRPPAPKNQVRQIADQVEEVIATLKRIATKKVRDDMARYGLPLDKAFGVPVGTMQKLAKQIGRNHELAVALWETGWYEARMIAAYLDDPQHVTPGQMDRWCRDFDNWGICDTVCFALFDRTPHAWAKVEQWAGRPEEFVKRAAFALLWGLTVHDKESGDQPFRRGLAFIERAATDDRHYVKKAVNMALRAVGKRNPSLHADALTVAKRLAESEKTVCGWIGRDALRELSSPRLRSRMAGRKK